MTKKTLAVLLVAGFLVTMLISSAVFAQEEDSTLEALYEKVYELRRQIVDRRVDLGHISEDDGNWMLERMEERFSDRSEEGFGRSAGAGGRSWNGDGNRGSGHCWRY